MSTPMKPLICELCETPVKPDVVLFGEQLTVNLMDYVHLIGQADLVFVLGTSLKVYPFNILVQVISKETPTVLINFEDVLST
jgi:NAD+-dependent protein deacetylase SIR2